MSCGVYLPYFGLSSILAQNVKCLSRTRDDGSFKGWQILGSLLQILQPQISWEWDSQQCRSQNVITLPTSCSSFIYIQLLTVITTIWLLFSWVLDNKSLPSIGPWQCLNGKHSYSIKHALIKFFWCLLYFEWNHFSPYLPRNKKGRDCSHNNACLHRRRTWIVLNFWLSNGITRTFRRAQPARNITFHPLRRAAATRDKWNIYPLDIHRAHLFIA